MENHKTIYSKNSNLDFEHVTCTLSELQEPEVWLRSLSPSALLVNRDPAVMCKFNKGIILKQCTMSTMSIEYCSLSSV